MTVKQTISDWLKGNESLFVQKYDELGFRASGDWEKGLSNSVEERDGKYIGKNEGLNYTYWMENSRKPGKFPPIDKIRKWIDDKKIQSDINKNSLAFIIARKIANEGTKHRPGIVSDVITQNRIDILIHAVGEVKLNEIRSEVIKTFKA